MKVVVSTVVDKHYQDYIPLFVYALTQSYPEYYLQIFTHHPANTEYIPAHILTALHDINNKKVTITEGVFADYPVKSGYEPISWRFLVPPKHYDAYDYVYITDIDMMIMPEKVDLAHFHLCEMGETGLCYSNSLRNSKHWMGSESFTGLHFVGKEWFDKTETLRKAFSNQMKAGTIGSKREFDGHMLWLMAKKSKIGLCKKYKLAGRHHGIHLGNFRLFKTMVKLRKRMGVEKCLLWQKWQRDRLFMGLCETASARSATVRQQLKAMDAHCKVVIK